jgi:uncharacterized surface protein with fasciclin (FAS1) repeats
MYTKLMAGAVLAALCVAPALAQSSMSSPSTMSGDSMKGSAMKPNPTVGGAPMSASDTIVTNAAKAPNLTTLVSLVKQAGLVETLSGPGPFTVFAPTNDAFKKLPEATVKAVTSDKALLTKVLTYHVVAGKLDAAAIVAKIKAGGGKATLKTVSGESLTASLDGSSVILTDAKGGKATVTTADVFQSNGVVHVIDSVLVP